LKALAKADESKIVDKRLVPTLSELQLAHHKKRTPGASASQNYSSTE